MWKLLFWWVNHEVHVLQNVGSVTNHKMTVSSFPFHPRCWIYTASFKSKSNSNWRVWKVEFVRSARTVKWNNKSPSMEDYWGVLLQGHGGWREKERRLRPIPAFTVLPGQFVHQSQRNWNTHSYLWSSQCTEYLENPPSTHTHTHTQGSWNQTCDIQAVRQDH